MTRIPQLEQELVVAAARLQSPPRRVGPAARAAVAAGALTVAAVVGLVVAAGDGGGRRAQPAGAVPFSPNATLEDMFGVFRRPATPADDFGFSKDDFEQIPDRQPGEDPTRARRVEWPDATVFLWPMQDGVCDSVAPRRGSGSGGGCVPLEHLRPRGVSIGIQSSRERLSVSGVVVDGIREVLLTAPGGPDLRVPVSENFFFVDLNAAAQELGAPRWEARVERVRWRYAGTERSSDIGRFLPRVSVPPAPMPSPDTTDAAPNPDVEPLAESASDPLRFTVAGTRYWAVGFHTHRSAVCTALTDVDNGTAPANSCLAERLLRDALQRQPTHLFAAGGGGAHGLVQTGFARADVIALTAVEQTSDVTVILSEPWRPEPWSGDPIRFFFVFSSDAGRPARPGRLAHVPLRARLDDGRTSETP
jgi:hypothetical protein